MSATTRRERRDNPVIVVPSCSNCEIIKTSYRGTSKLKAWRNARRADGWRFNSKGRWCSDCVIGTGLPDPIMEEVEA